MESGSKSLVSVDESKVKEVESKNKPKDEIAFLLLGVLTLILSFYLWNKWRDGDISGWVGTIVFMLAVFFMYLGSKHDDVIKAKIQDERKAKVDTLLQSIEGFEVAQHIVLNSNELLIAVDDINQKFCVIDTEIRVFSYKDIVGVELFEDGVQLTKTSRGSQLGGAILGGVLAGGVGAVIGGLSGKTTTTNELVKSISLRVILNDTNKPFFIGYFLKENEEINKNSNQYEEALKLANHWFSLISVLIKQADEKDTAPKEIVKSGNDQRSVADELLKLSELMKQGFITGDEFEKQKKKLLS